MNDNVREIVEWELLWLRCRRRDPDVMRCLIRKMEQPLYYFVRRIVVNDADSWDVLQQVWIRVLAGMATVSSAGSMKAWLYRTARNTALNHIRSDQRYRAAVENYGDIPTESDAGQESIENADEVHRALDQLELPYRETLTLHFLEEMSVRDLAEVLDLPEGTVKSRLYVGKRKLKSILETNHGPQS